MADLLKTWATAGMSDLASLFKTQEGMPQFYGIPQTKAQKQATELLRQLMGETPTIPLRQVAGLTPTEQQAQELLARIVGGKEPAYQTGYEELMKTATGGYADITKAPYYAPMIKDIQKAATSSARRMQMGGMGTSGAAQDVIGKQVSQNILAAIGPYIQSERDRQEAAIRSLMGVPLTTLGAVGQYGGLPRQISQEKANALYEQLMQQLNVPYQYQAPIASQVLGQQYYYTPGATTQPSIFSQIAPLLPYIMMAMGG